MKRFFVAIAGLLGGWMWSRGHKDPRQWPKHIGREVSALWDDLDDAFAAARRTNRRQQDSFDDELRRARPDET